MELKTIIKTHALSYNNDYNCKHNHDTGVAQATEEQTRQTENQNTECRQRQNIRKVNHIRQDRTLEIKPLILSNKSERHTIQNILQDEQADKPICVS